MMTELNNICPFIGLAEDPATRTSFPSSLNHCHNAQPVEVIEFTYQREYCLTEKYIECPVYLQKEGTPLPIQLRAPDTQASRQRSINWKILLLAIIIIAVLVFIVNGLFFGGNKNAAAELPATRNIDTGLSPETQNAAMAITQTPKANVMTTYSDKLTITAASLTPPPPASVGTRVITSTKTIMPTYTSAQSPTLYIRNLDTPIGMDYVFIIHRVKVGENFEILANTYQTSAVSILRVNYSILVPLWVDALVVIPVKFTDVTGIPYFETYMVTNEGTTKVDDLARKLGTNLEDFKYYNDFRDGETLYNGNWVLVPR